MVHLTFPHILANWYPAPNILVETEHHNNLPHYVDFVEDPLDLRGPPGLPSRRSKSKVVVFLSASGEVIARVSSDEADMALTCAITTCAFRASSSSSRMRCCLKAARFSASRARFSAAVRTRFGGCTGESFEESLLECLVLSALSAASETLCACPVSVIALFTLCFSSEIPLASSSRLRSASYRNKWTAVNTKIRLLKPCTKRHMLLNFSFRQIQEK